MQKGLYSDMELIEALWEHTFTCDPAEHTCLRRVPHACSSLPWSLLLSRRYTSSVRAPGWPMQMLLVSRCASMLHICWRLRS